MQRLKKWWPASRERPPPERAPLGQYDLDTPLLYFSPHDAWTIRDACEGVQIFGSIGSGKTSGSGAAIARAFLRAGFGGLVLCAKPEECQLWERYAKETGREKQLVIIRPGSPWRFNFLDYELSREGRGGGMTENLVNLFTSVIAIAEGKVEQVSGDGAYWQRASRQLLRNAIELLALAQRSITLADIYRIINDAPQSRDDTESAQWWGTSFTAECLKLADAKEKTPLEAHDYQMVETYWLNAFANLDQRPRSGIVSTFTSVADLLLHGYAWELFGTDTNIVPEVTWKNGAIIVLDLPIQEFGEAGRICQGIFKLMFQKAVLRRDARQYPRPIYLFADESQAVALSSFDYQFQAVARSVLACTVYLSQSISNYYSVLGASGRDETHALLGNFQTKIFHANSDHATNLYAADLISQERATNYSFNSGASQNGVSHSAGGSEAIRYKVLPAAFTTLRKGGPANHLQVEAVVFQGGRIWKATGDTTIKSIFHQ